MNFDENSLVHFLKQNNAGGIVALPPTPCLRAACLSAYAAARVERIGSPRKRHFRQIGPVSRTSEIRRICPEEQLQ
jgi:hypothetical protein